MLKFIHAADFHLDSAFGALTAQQAAARRRESREVAFRLANYVNSQGISLVLLAGDLFDSAAAYRETGEQLAQALGQMEAKVFIAPGNHDWYGSGSPWLTVSWPENVHIFSSSTPCGSNKNLHADQKVSRHVQWIKNMLCCLYHTDRHRSMFQTQEPFW